MASLITVWRVKKKEGKQAKPLCWVFDRMDVALGFLRAEFRELAAGDSKHIAYSLDSKRMTRKAYNALIEAEE